MLDQTSYNQESEISLFELFLMIKKVLFIFLSHLPTLIGGGLASIFMLLGLGTQKHINQMLKSWLMDNNNRLKIFINK